MPTSIDTSNEIRSNFERHRVSVADTLTTGSGWTEVEYLYLRRLERTIAPQVDTAELLYHYGAFAVREGGGEGGKFSPQELDRKYVKIEITTDEDTEYENPLVTWYGTIEVDEKETGGTRDETTIATGSTPMGDQTLTAYGLLREMERTIIRHSDVLDRNGDVIRINRGIPFNFDPSGDIPEFGNRSEDLEETEDGTALIFSNDPSGGEQWSAIDAVQYLLYTHAPEDEFGDDTASWGFDNIVRAIEVLDWYAVSVRTDRRPLKDVFDELIDRRRGVGYRVYGEEDENTFRVQLDVFTFADVPIPLNDTFDLPVNDDLVTLDFEEAFDVEVARLRDNSTHLADKVVVEGAWITTTFSIEYDQATGLVEGWDLQSGGDEEDYKAGASNGPGYSDLSVTEKKDFNARARSRERYIDVYRRWILANNHPYQAYPPYEPNTTYWLSPNLTALDSIPPGAEDPNLDLVYRSDLSNEPPIWLRGKRFLPFLPRKQQNDEGYQAPFVVINTGLMASSSGTAAGDDVYEFVHRLNANAGSSSDAAREFAADVLVLESRPGIRLESRAPQMLAKSNFAGAALTHTSDDPSVETNNAVDYKDGLWATVAIETDEKVRENYTITNNQAGRLQRIQVIPLPDARLDVMLPGTITDLDDLGRLETSENGEIIRDDRDRMKSIARAAGVWYGTKRQALTLVWNQVNPVSLELGDLVTSIGDTYTDPDVNSVISKMTFDLDEGTTRLETSYADLDFGVLSGDLDTLPVQRDGGGGGFFTGEGLL